ncbi:MAG: HAD-IB family phosphatase [Candidatus Altiarchaeota archaeon]|nr:HAD-IB family phosphatase [Candidatus Altiarchaeota archaeon]
MKKQTCVVLDFDHTLSSNNTWNIAREVMDVDDPVHFYRSYKATEDLDGRAEIAKEWAMHNFGEMTGFSQEHLAEMYELMELNPGALGLVEYSKSQGYRTGLLSAAFPPLLEQFAQELGIEILQGFEISYDEITKEFEMKKSFSDKDKRDYVIDLKNQGYRVIMIGDGENDIPALEHADLGIKVFSQEPGSYLNATDLSHALELLQQAGY